MLETNNPALKSWIEVPKGSDFPIQNLPFGIFKTRYLTPVAGVAIGEFIVDLVYLHEHGYLDVRHPVELHQIAQDRRDVHHDDAEVESGHEREDDLDIHFP